MDTKHLRTFVAVTDLESFTRAGRRLGMSQSAISQQLSALEKQLGVTLLVRSGSGARPTPAGEVLLQYARQILRKMEEAQRVLGDYDTHGAGVLRIGAGGAACHYLLPSVLKQFHERHAQVELHVLSGHTRLTVERLIEADLDLGIVTLPLAQTRLRISDVGTDELVAIAAPSHPWAERRRIQPSDFGDQPLLIYERRSQTFHLIERLLLEAGIFPHIAMEMDHLEAVTEMVRVGFGVAIVPRWAVKADVAAGQLVALPIGKSGLVRRWGLAFVDDTHRRQSVRAFGRLCADLLPRLLAAEV